MKLEQIIKDKKGTHYVYKCEMCGHTVTTNCEILKCPVCSEWIEDVVKEMEENNVRPE